MSYKMSYNTFHNDTDIIINVNVDTDLEEEKLCIICIDKTPLNKNDNVTLMNEMHFLVKGCDCICYAHHKCIEKWIETNAVCPICKRVITFPLTSLNNKGQVIVDPLILLPSNISNTYVSIIIIIAIIFIISLLQIIQYRYK